jgi:hypothetical protein
MSGIGDIAKFETFSLKDQFGKLKKNPERAFIGAMDKGGSMAWGKLLGKDYEPMTDWFGGAPSDAYGKAEAAGINVAPGRSMHNVAKSIVGIYAGGYGADKLGMIGGGGESLGNVAQPAQEGSSGFSNLLGNSQSSSGFGLNSNYGSGVQSTGFGTTSGGSFGGMNPAYGSGVQSTGFGTTSGGGFGLNAASGMGSTQQSASLAGTKNPFTIDKAMSMANLAKGMGGQGQQQAQLPQVPQGQISRGQQVNVSDPIAALLAPKRKKKQPISLL